MQEDFLDYLDKKQEDYRDRFRIKNGGYINYSVLKPVNVAVNEKFYLAKGRKTRVLIFHNKIWVDLTDYDIIDIICNLDDTVVKKILEELKECYKGKWTEFLFEIDGKEFKGKGLDYKKYELNKKIYLAADFEIGFSDFLFVINMILYKDIEGEKYVERKNPLQLIEITLIKYISLILYYKFDDDKAKNYLLHIKYPCFERMQLLEKKMKVKKYDRCFSKIEFEKMLLS